MLTKKAYTLEELFLYLEALEMLDMIYTVQKFPEEENEYREYVPAVWSIEYRPGASKGKPIEFED
jgi:hypothetical protein